VRRLLSQRTRRIVQSGQRLLHRRVRDVHCWAPVREPLHGGRFAGLCAAKLLPGGRRARGATSGVRHGHLRCSRWWQHCDRVRRDHRRAAVLVRTGAEPRCMQCRKRVDGRRRLFVVRLLRGRPGRHVLRLHDDRKSLDAGGGILPGVGSRPWRSGRIELQFSLSRGVLSRASTARVSRIEGR